LESAENEDARHTRWWQARLITLAQKHDQAVDKLD